MMEHFGKHIEDETKKTFDHKKRRLRCLAHIINLATQALLSTHSKSKYVDVTKSNDDLVVSRHGHRDEIGLIRSIAVKVCMIFNHCLFIYIAHPHIGTVFCFQERTFPQDSTSSRGWRCSCCSRCCQTTPASFGYEGAMVLDLCDAPPCI
jgi:hypothetical protein